MYQSLKSDTLPSTPTGPALRPVNDGDQRYDRRAAPTSGLASITPLLVLGWIRRYWFIALGVAFLGTVAGLAAAILIPPRYTSSSDILLDPNDLHLLEDDIYSRAATGESQIIEVESRMRILTSASVLGRVVDTLGLASDPEFVEPGAAVGADARIAALRALGDRVKASREERSYIVTASAWGHTPEQSVILTDAVVNAFLAELAGADAQGASAASAELNQRLLELGNEAAKAETAVVDYRRQHGLSLASNDQLSTQSAVEINVQVDRARQVLIDAEARYAALVSGQTGSDAQGSTTLSELRAEYAVARQKVESLSATLGSRHPTLSAAAAELAALQNEIDNELGRVVEVAQNDLQRARDVFDQLKNVAAAQSTDVFTDETAQLELRQLERTATSAVAIYETYLTRARQTGERSQLNTSTIRVISPAFPPLVRSYPPRTVLLVAGGLFAGLALGLVLAAGLGLLGMLMRPLPKVAIQRR
ncbi:Uncharacterized protein involved in exopolysaccharide biosynthesis [Devosia psychrophila]|uniref:Uncharacterized protein involved in exopolysaccharide biosynthesis n=2 Tax=Devosia psychrophila TaxID=728005 RepID=A0A1I1SC57_9HYPH|nr:Uncharacterized protein involved in exopolysaccharide biosynthesis [Devosia psychrophila]